MKLNSWRNTFALVVLTGTMVSAVCEAVPLFESQPLFTPTPSNYYHIPGLVVTARGTVLAYASWRDVRATDWGDIHTVLRRSSDGGKSWGPEHKIAHLGVPVQAIVRSSPPKAKGHEDDVTVDNPVAFADANGAVHFIYCVEYRRVFYMRSDDDGLSWSQPVEISQAFEKYRPQFDWKVVATGPGHGIQLANGRLLVPIWLATGGAEGYHHAPTITSVLYSDDHGANWQGGDVVATTTGLGNDPNVFHNPNETVAAQLADGSVLFNLRAPSWRHRRLQSTSPDGVSQWSKPAFVEDLPEPICFGSIARLSAKPGDDKNRLLFSIDTGTTPGRKKKSYDEQGFNREDMGAFVSYDEGKTWPVKKIIQAGPCGCGYSDLTTLPDGTILCAYGSGQHFGRGAGIDLARFNLEWLTDGKDSFIRKK
jgi:sialidase-1